MRRLLLAGWIALAGILALLPARAEVPVPPLKARVTDLTGTLSAAQKGDLESRIAAWEAKRGSQLAVLMLASTKPEEIDQYSIRVAEAWKIGRKGVDDGLLLIVAKDDRRLRIEVGYGLEGAIPDSVAHRVIEEWITPRFRDGDFFGGLRDGVDQLIRLAEGEKLASPRAQRFGGGVSVEILLFAFVLTVVAGSILKALLGRIPGSLATGAAFGLIGWLMFGVGLALLAAVAGFVLTYANTGEWEWSSGGSGDDSCGGGSSSGWGGGGGGGFGGGGASGRW